MISFAESAPNGPRKEHVLASLKNIDASPHEAEALYSEWLEQKQWEMDQSQSEYSSLIYNVTVAELLFEANLIEDAREYCEVAWGIIRNELSHLDPMRTPQEIHDLYDKLDFISDQIL